MFYRENSLNAKFTEVSFDFDDDYKPIVILKRSDAMYAKLVEGYSWYGLSEAKMETFKSAGGWKLVNSSSGTMFSILKLTIKSFLFC